MNNKPNTICPNCNDAFDCNSVKIKRIDTYSFTEIYVFDCPWCGEETNNMECDGIEEDDIDTQTNYPYYHPIKVKYKNWKGEIKVRKIIPLFIHYGCTEYHIEDQWLMDVWDEDKDAPRTYAMMDIIEFIKED
jgi:hypothetical protein